MSRSKLVTGHTKTGIAQVLGSGVTDGREMFEAILGRASFLASLKRFANSIATFLERHD